MTNRILRAFALTAGIAGLLTLTACGDDVVRPTFGAGCREGALRASETATGTINEESCRLAYHFYTGDEHFYDAYRVELVKGKGYMFTLQQQPDAEGENSLDALLTLWGRDAAGNSVPLAMSDDDAEGIEGHDSEFYFIAPTSGTFYLVAGNYGSGDFGGYKLAMRECPVVATVDTSGSYYDIPFADSDCIRHAMAGGAPSRIVLVAIPTEGDESIDVAVSSDEFAPYIEMGGPGIDVFANIYEETSFNWSTNSPARALLGFDDVRGTVTLAVGASTLDPVGRFSIGFERTPASLEPLARADRAALTFAPRQAPATKR